jgi:hypothetical protein
MISGNGAMPTTAKRAPETADAETHGHRIDRSMAI